MHAKNFCSECLDIFKNNFRPAGAYAPMSQSGFPSRHKQNWPYIHRRTHCALSFLPLRIPTSIRRGRTRRRKNLARCAARWTIGLIAVHNARERRVKLNKTLILSTWSSATLMKELLGMVNFYQLFFLCFRPRNGVLIRMLIFSIGGIR
jgi:hypothetical protein